jgi:uncharacterized protein (TIGR00375 family)
MKYNIDLHIHSPYASGVSKNMSLPILAKEAKLKGLNVLGTGDILHPDWFKHVKENLISEKDSYVFKEDKDSENKTYFILTTEVETAGRVHHLLFFRDFTQVLEFKKDIEKFSSDMSVYGGGRPRLSIGPSTLLDLCIKHDVIIGPAHAFTPYFGIFSGSDSLKEAYGENYKEIRFIELGLSADSISANVIPELKDIKFFSFSDAHSPNSYRIGREYVCVELEKPNFESIKNLLYNLGDNKILFNVGYNPQEGKYNRTACRDCKKIHKLEDAIKNNWRCLKCRGILKKGVADRIIEIAKIQGNLELKQITNRPEYKYLIPLAQIIQLKIGKGELYNKRVLEKYEKLITKHTEIEIMLELPEEKLKAIDEDIAKLVIAFRNGLVVFRPGGGGHYGVPFICFSEEEKKVKEIEILKEQEIPYVQKTLF